MKIHVVTYNLAMGADRNNDHLVSSDADAADVFCNEFSKLVKQNSGDPWFFCVQEINQGPVYPPGVFPNYVEQMQNRLESRTGLKWWKHSNMHYGELNRSTVQESVAIFSTRELVKEQKYNTGSDRAGQAVKAKLSDTKYVWVVTAHPIKKEEDTDGRKRKAEVECLLEHIVTFDPTTPVVLTGDFNIKDVAPGTYGGSIEPAVYDVMIPLIERFGFVRGTNFVPGPADITAPSWQRDSFGLIDYIFVNTAGVCTPGRPSVLNFTAPGSTKYASDHKGVQLAIDYP